MDKLNTNVHVGRQVHALRLSVGREPGHRDLVLRRHQLGLHRGQDRDPAGPQRPRRRTLFRTIVPGASIDSPLGNTLPYQDLANNIRYNAITQGAGLGYLDTGRDQANLSLALFRGDHELKFGADYQDVFSETFNVIGTLYRGRGYNENLPGGFTTPQDKRVFDPTSPVETTADIYSAYAQDRFDVTSGSTSTSASAWTTRPSTTTPARRSSRRPTSRRGWPRPGTPRATASSW